MIGKIPPNKYDVIMEDGVRVVTAQFWDDCEKKLGTYMEDTDYDFVVEEDTDFYAPPECDVNLMDGCEQKCHNCVTEDNIIFKLRKGVFTDAEQLGAYEGLLHAAKPTQNRGVASGPKGKTQGGRDWVTDEQIEIMDHFIHPSNSLFDEGDPIAAIRAKYLNKEKSSTRGIVWLRSKIEDNGYDYHDFFETKVAEWTSQLGAAADAKLVKETFISDTTYANQVNSGIAGFFDRYPRIPYGRATSYTENNYEEYEKCYPFMRKLADKFGELLPRRHAVQVAAADRIDPAFRVAGTDTPFTTITVNKNFRTAAHRDAGDLHQGFSNLTVVANDKNWEGGYLVLPEFRVAINIRPGDLLLINNHAGIHGNTELKPPEGKKVGEMERISLVCYFREKMLELGTHEYERTRFNYVESRRLNQNHPEWREYWNGISTSMWDSQEWYTFLRQQPNGQNLLHQYHPKANHIAASLEEFF